MSGQTAFAALNFALKVNDGSVPVEAHILPQGPFRSKDGSSGRSCGMAVR